MNIILKSRLFQICVVTTTLMVVLWLSSTMWINALDQRRDVQKIFAANTYEELIFDIADAIAAERRLMYKIYSTNEVNPSAVEKLRQLSAKTDLLVSENESFLASNPTTIRQLNESGHGHHHGTINDLADQVSSGQHTAHSTDAASSSHLNGRSTDDSMAATPSNHSAASHANKNQDAGEFTTVVAIVNQLRQDEQTLYEQLLSNRRDRQPTYGMARFHKYASAIESLDVIRHAYQTLPIQNFPEHYIATKRKDAIWVSRESIQQISSLLEGIVEMSSTTHTMAQTEHHADMLIELNVRVDMSWNDLLKTVINSDSDVLASQARNAAVWYMESFRSVSSNLAASTRLNSVSMDSLREWIAVTQQLSARTETIRDDSKTNTLESIERVKSHATIKLLVTTALVLFGLFMVVASVVFFRRIDRQAHQDELTGLDNRRMFCNSLRGSISASNNTDSEVGLLMIDLDRFKYINDTMGHAAGDAILKDVARRLAEVAGECRSIARLGGDEFAMLFQDSSASKLDTAAGLVRQIVIEPFHINGATLHIGASIGIAQYPRDASTFDSLIQAADLAMYCAKKSGTNQIVEYDSEIDQTMAMTAKTVNELQLAIQDNQFELYYQPQFNLTQARILSVEALIRWNHPERGYLTPDHFLPIAEESGLMPAIGDWVINEACQQAAVWLNEKKMPLRVAVNISSDHFFQPDFVQKILDCLKRNNLPPQFLEVEVTEGMAMTDLSLVVDSLKKLRESSIHVALDDFGTGYSSLRYLQELPLDTLKIDKTFIQNMFQENVQNESVTQTIVSLAKTLDLQTVAEGVETAEQLTAVSDMCISIVQGYYYSKPVSAKDIELVIKKINEDNIDQKAA